MDHLHLSLNSHQVSACFYKWKNEIKKQMRLPIAKSASEIGRVNMQKKMLIQEKTDDEKSVKI